MLFIITLFNSCAVRVCTIGSANVRAATQQKSDSICPLIQVTDLEDKAGLAVGQINDKDGLIRVRLVRDAISE